MLYVSNQDVTDPHINLALEEHLLRNVKSAEPLLLFYINEPTVVIGRNQNALEEVDPDYLELHKMHLVRRLSGGGAVYHDLGNLNFSFITNGSRDLHNFAKFTAPVVAVLREFGIDAELRNKSSLFANGKKISGNAQYMTGSRMFSHGTLLFDTNLEHLLKALNPRRVQITSRAVQSVRSVVTNLREHLPPGMTIYDLREALLHGILGTTAVPTYDLTDADWAQIEAYADERYRSWAWNVGRSPQFKVEKQVETAVGTVNVCISVENGRIKSIEFDGILGGVSDELARRLLETRYERASLTEAVNAAELEPYLGQMAPLDLLHLLY